MIFLLYPVGKVLGPTEEKDESTSFRALSLLSVGTTGCFGELGQASVFGTATYSAVTRSVSFNEPGHGDYWIQSQYLRHDTRLDQHGYGGDRYSLGHDLISYWYGGVNLVLFPRCENVPYPEGTARREGHRWDQTEGHQRSIPLSQD